MCCGQKLEICEAPKYTKTSAAPDSLAGGEGQRAPPNNFTDAVGISGFGLCLRPPPLLLMRTTLTTGRDNLTAGHGRQTDTA